MRTGLPKRGKHLESTTCDVPANNKSMLSTAQEVEIESNLSEEDVPTNEAIVSNPFRSADKSISKVNNIIMNNIKFPKRKHANPALDVANLMKTKRV
jgi:hypothetical protein